MHCSYENYSHSAKGRSMLKKPDRVNLADGCIRLTGRAESQLYQSNWCNYGANAPALTGGELPP